MRQANRGICTKYLMHRTGPSCKGVVALKQARPLNLLEFSPNRGQTVWLVRVAGLAADSRLGMILGPLAPVIPTILFLCSPRRVGRYRLEQLLECLLSTCFPNNNSNGSRHSPRTDMIDLGQLTSSCPLFSWLFRLYKIGPITPECTSCISSRPD